MEEEKKNKLTIGAIALALVVVLIITIVNLIYKSTHTAKLYVTVAPQTSKIVIGGREYENGEYDVVPGDYHVELSKDGFDSVSMDLQITNDNPGYVFVMLRQSDGTNTWYEEHPEDAILSDPIENQFMAEQAKRIAEEYPLTTRLPFEIDSYSANYASHTHYKVSYSVESDGSVIVIITDYTGGNEQDALEKIRARGYNPADYTIRYDDESENQGWGYAGND